jgi:hypothetical protein
MTTTERIANDIYGSGDPVQIAPAGTRYFDTTNAAMYAMWVSTGAGWLPITPLATRAVAALPAAAAGNRGWRCMVTDANAAFTAGIGAVVAAGGANVVPVVSDGAAWRIG